MTTHIRLPRFARELQQQMRCIMCDKKLTEADIMFVGASRTKDDRICFAYEARCPKCDRFSTVVDTVHSFTQSDWWVELARWHNESYAEKGPFIKLNGSSDDAVARVLIAPSPLRTLNVYFGCKGDVGPVVLFCHGNLFPEGFGACRLERNDQLRILLPVDPDNILPVQWFQLRQVPEGGPFQSGGRTWTRMTRKELREIVRDRVFTLAGSEASVTTAKKKCRSKHAAPKASTRRKVARRSS